MSTAEKNTRHLVPQLRFKRFNGEWQCKKLSDLFTKKTKKNTGSKERFVLTNSATQGIVGQLDYFEKDIANQDNLEGYYIVDIDDFVYNPRISKHAPVGPLKRNNYRRGIMSPLYTVLKPKVTTLGYLEKYFDTQKWHKYMYKISNYGARHDRMNIGQTDLLNLPIPFPDFPEQQKIADLLNAVDAWINNLKQQKEGLEAYKKGMMQKILNQEIRFKDKEGKDFPKWKAKQLSEILIEHKTRNSDNKYTEVFSVAKEKGVINQIEHLGRSFASEDLSNYKIVFPNDIIYTKSPTADFPFGIIKQNKLERAGIVSTLYGVFKPINPNIGSLLHTYFLSWINTYNYLIPLVSKGAKNTINISNTNFLNGAKICLPINATEQEKIVSFIYLLDKKIDAKKNILEKAEQWKKGLMQQLFV